MESQLLTTVRDSALTCHTQVSTTLGDNNDINDEVIHQLRVQTKRLRAYWELLHPCVGKAHVKSATKELGNASSRFGAARDHHVMVQLLGKLVGKAKKPKLQSALADTLKVLTDLPAAMASSSDTLPTGDDVAKTWQRDRRRWESIDARPDSDSQGNHSVGEGLQRIFKKARKLHQRAIVENDIERWHDLRKWVKYLSLIVPLFGDDPATSIAAGEWARLGKSLGKLHDYDELAKQITQLTSDQLDEGQSARAVKWITSKRDRLCVQCDMHARRLLAQRPASFAKTLIH